MTNSYKDQLDPVKQPEEFVIAATQNVNMWAGYYSSAIIQARLMRNFTYVSAWTAAEKRERFNRPTLDFNNIQPIVRALLAEQREADPQLQLFSISGDVPQQQIEMREDLIRHISYQSNSKMVYQTGYKDAIDCGYGAWVVKHDYESPDSFNKKLMLRPIKDVLACFWAPDAEHPNKTDAMFSGYTITMSKKEFERRWPDSDIAGAASPMLNEVAQLTYDQADKVCYVTEYYYKEFYNKTVFLLENGKSYTKDEYEKYSKKMKKLRKKLLALKPILNPQDYQKIIDTTEISPVIEKRTSTDFRIRCCLLTRTDVLETSEVPGKKMPLIYVEGFSTIIDGRQIPIPFAKAAVDPQRLLNYTGSTIAETLAKSRKEQYILTPTMIAGREQYWRDTSNIQGALVANPDPMVPGALPVPQQAAPFNGALSQVYVQCQNDVRATTGRFAENAGAEGSAESGLAVLQKQASGNLTVGIYPDNLLDAIAETGRVLVGMMPETYDNDRMITLKGKGGDSYTARINYKSDMPTFNPDTFEDEYETINDFSAGEFDVEVVAGASFAAQQMQQQQMIEAAFSASQSPLFNNFSDLYFENMNAPNKNEFVKRAKNFLVDPAIIAMDKGEQPPPPPEPSPLQKVQMMSELMQSFADLKDAEAKLNQIKVDNLSTVGDIITESMKLKSQQTSDRASEIASAAEIVKALSESEAKKVESASRIARSIIDTENANLRAENDEYKGVLASLFSIQE